MLTQSAVAQTYARILLAELTGHQTVDWRGTRRIGGVAATGTEVRLTLTQLLKLLPELSPAMVGDVATLANQVIDTTVWVDQRGRLVDITMAASKGSAASVSGSVRFSDYDAPDRVTAPPAATVKPIPAALRSVLNGLSFFGA